MGNSVIKKTYKITRINRESIEYWAKLAISNKLSQKSYYENKIKKSDIKIITKIQKL